VAYTTPVESRMDSGSCQEDMSPSNPLTSPASLRASRPAAMPICTTVSMVETRDSGTP
jgi:hypothetical protein